MGIRPTKPSGTLGYLCIALTRVGNLQNYSPLGSRQNRCPSSHSAREESRAQIEKQQTGGQKTIACVDGGPIGLVRPHPECFRVAMFVILNPARKVMKTRDVGPRPEDWGPDRVRRPVAFPLPPIARKADFVRPADLRSAAADSPPCSSLLSCPPGTAKVVTAGRDCSRPARNTNRTRQVEPGLARNDAPWLEARSCVQDVVVA